ncbi:MAG: DUF456 domain-containing protein [Gemmatimonadetes bacterium]|nr:DUF456 domain-containing protein [Gemmatimonadota bacterium]
MAAILLSVSLLAGLLLVPLGLPGLWVMLGATFVYWLAVPGGAVGGATMLVVGALVAAAEVLEFTIAGRYAKRYGGSSRASWGAVAGGLVGAVVGVPVPIIGPLLGAFAGAFAGALVGELTVTREVRGAPLRVAGGALLGRVVAAGVKTGFAALILVWVASALLVQRLNGAG